MSTCPGTCCRAFPLNPSLEETLERQVARDAVQIMDAERLIEIIEIIPDQPFTYRCTMFDGRLCTAYEQRPDMCRRYPYGRPCAHCSYDDRFPNEPGLPWRPVEETGIFTPFDALCLSTEL